MTIATIDNDGITLLIDDTNKNFIELTSLVFGGGVNV
jgi:hypothetical protein